MTFMRELHFRASELASEITGQTHEYTACQDTDAQWFTTVRNHDSDVKDEAADTENVEHRTRMVLMSQKSIARQLRVKTGS